MAPHWPEPWGLGADPALQLVVDEELRRAGVRRPENTIGIGWAGPDPPPRRDRSSRRTRYLLPLLAADEIWCQLFSEPGAGSDLASLTTRAELDGDEWVVQGQKVWTSYAHLAQFGILLARTEPDAPKHQGISYFICPMDAPGITVRPLVDMTGAHTFNEVFLDEVRLPRENLVGERGQGWSLGKVTLANERVSLSGAGALWGMGPTADDLVDTVRAAGGVTDPLLRQRLARVWAEGEILRLLRMRTVAAAVAGCPPRARGVGPQGTGRRPRPAHHGTGPRPGRGHGDAGRDRSGSGQPGCGTLARRHVVLRIPVRPRAHHRGRDLRGPAEHHRRADPRAAPRPPRLNRSRRGGGPAQPTSGPASS